MAGNHREPLKKESGKPGNWFSLLMELTKIRLVALVLLSTAVGYFLAVVGPVPVLHFCNVLLSTGMVAAGSLALNQWMEWQFDARMKRTKMRPIPSGRMKPAVALLLGLFFSAAGLFYLASTAPPLAAVLAALTWVSYLLVYTPLKRKTSLNTIVGALPGAIPPMIGWSAVRGNLAFEAWILFSILFLWQLPHFLAIAWLYRKEYRDAGFVMLSLEDPEGKRVAFHAFFAAALLLPVSLLPTIFNLTGMIYFFTALLLGLIFAGISLASLKDIEKKARPLFGMSILYLSLLLTVMVLDKN